MDYTSIASAFNRPKAKIDFITVGVPSRLSAFSASEFEAAMRGMVRVSSRKHDNWLNVTVHDPEFSDLQWLLDNWPEAIIWGIEIAVDFTLKDGSNDLDQLIPLHGWLNHRLFPQRHAAMKQAKRHFFGEDSNKRKMTYRLDTLKTKARNTTLIWRDWRQKVKTRCYVKQTDNNQPYSKQHAVRLEVTLSGGGCQCFGLFRVAELPEFADRMRREFSRCFHIAESIKSKQKRVRSQKPEKMEAARKDAEHEARRVARSWELYGAAWAARHGYNVKPDAAANDAIGLALKNLREHLLPLKLTRKVAEKPMYDGVEVPVKHSDFAFRSAAPISERTTQTRINQDKGETEKLP